MNQFINSEHSGANDFGSGNYGEQEQAMPAIGTPEFYAIEQSEADNKVRTLGSVGTNVVEIEGGQDA